MILSLASFLQESSPFHFHSKEFSAKNPCKNQLTAIKKPGFNGKANQLFLDRKDHKYRQMDYKSRIHHKRETTEI
jgi:hypothetical protein